MPDPADPPNQQVATGAGAGGGKSAGGGGTLMAVVGIGAALVVGATVIGARMHGTPSNGSEIAIVAQGDIAAAAATLSAQAANAVEEAKSCKTPMAAITIAKKPGTAPGVIRIRSGSYVSPAFTLGDTPQRVAIPFPTPYPTGIGTLNVEGEASGAVVSLYPAVNIEALKGSSPISVWWVPRKPC
ncbi:MAG: hypothetical protein P4M07_09025 [Xanthobacteraceae bacterium]|nr:hypothetical protein [Xanthobacteraceae bacterium]